MRSRTLLCLEVSRYGQPREAVLYCGQSIAAIHLVAQGLYKLNWLCAHRDTETTFVTRRRESAIHSRRTRIAEAAIRRRDQTLERARARPSSSTPNNQAFARARYSAFAACLLLRSHSLSGATVRYTLRVSPSVLSIVCCLSHVGCRRPPWRLTLSARTSALANASSAPLSRGDHTLGTSCTFGSLVGASSSTDAC
jgi:hypothetical protein